MRVRHYLEVVAREEMPGVLLHTAVSAGDGAPRFAMRYSELSSGSPAPLHCHWWEHEDFSFSGEGEIRGPHRESPPGETNVTSLARPLLGRNHLTLTGTSATDSQDWD